jgi:nicotinamidase-related amidase
MPAKNQDLHGFVPDNAPVALILIDVINDLEWQDGEQILPAVLDMAPRLAAFKRRCKQAGIPAIYLNDNFGKWQSDMASLVEHCLNGNVRGKPFVEQIQPEKDDYFVLKPKSSGFFATTLETLLHYLQAKALILTGIAGNICVQFTAQDAYLRDYLLYVPADCIASNSPTLNQHALEHMRTITKADITPSDTLDLDAVIMQAQTC